MARGFTDQSFDHCASEFRVWGCLALVRNTSTDKLSARTFLCVFLGFPVDTPDFMFYHPPLHRFLDSRDVQFNDCVSYYARYPCQGPSFPPLPFSSPPLLLLLLILWYTSPSLSSSQSLQQPSALLRHVAVDSRGVGARAEGTSTGGASSEDIGVGGTCTRGASSGGVGVGGTGTGGVKLY
ncbi:unnamed protein product [Closterium sp. NIES-54]